MGWGRVVVFYFRVLVNVCVCVSSVRVLGVGGTVVAFCFCVLGNVYSYLMFRLCVLLLPPQKNNAPLHIAAACGKEAVAELLLRHKADVNMVGEVSADGCAGGGREGGGVGEGCCISFSGVGQCACVCI